MAGYKHLEIPSDFQKYVKDKKESARAYYRYLLSRVLRMFQYKNLPDTIPHEILDRYLFMNGIACITKVDGQLYAFYGNLGGPQDVYYRPTEFIISNPHIKTSDGQLFTANVPVFPCDTDYQVGQPIRTEGVLIRNDTEWVGLHPLIARYAYLMAENTLTLRTADVMLRVIALITAKTDKELAAANEYIKSLEKGELGVIGESAFHEGIEMQSPPSNNGSYLTQFIEYQQYLKGSFFGDIGLSANYNMKREAIGKGESTLDQDALLPLAENMLKCRQEDLAKVNDMFGTEISVEFSSSWLTNKIETLATLTNLSTPTSPFAMGQPSGEGGEVNQGEESEAESGADSGSEPSTDKETNQRSEEEPVKEEVEEQVEKTDEETVEVMEPPKSENSESKVNDISIDEEFTDILEELENKDSGLTNSERSEENGDSNDEESTEDKSGISDN